MSSEATKFSVCKNRQGTYAFKIVIRTNVKVEGYVICDPRLRSSPYAKIVRERMRLKLRFH